MSNRERPEQGAFNLASLVNFENPERSRYDALIAKVARDNENRDMSGRELQTSHGMLWLEWYYKMAPGQQSYEKNHKFAELLKERVRGKILVDLGGGRLQFFAEELGASKYIGVYLYADAPPEQESDPQRIVKEEQKGALHTVQIKDDTLDFVSRLQPGSVNIMINGIDQAVIQDEDYHRALAKEIARVCLPGGIAFGNNGSPLYFIDDSEMPTVFSALGMLAKTKG